MKNPPLMEASLYVESRSFSSYYVPSFKSNPNKKAKTPIFRGALA